MADKLWHNQQQKQQATSLLLSPPERGFSFGSSDGSATTFLVPVAQSDNSSVQNIAEAEADNFLGQIPLQTEEPPPFKLFQQVPSNVVTNVADPFAAFAALAKTEPSFKASVSSGAVTGLTSNLGSETKPPISTWPVSDKESHLPHSLPSSLPHSVPHSLPQSLPFASPRSELPPLPTEIGPADHAVDGQMTSQSTKQEIPSPASLSPITPLEGHHIPPPDLRRQSGVPIYPIQYKPVQPHWFYCKEIEKRLVWLPFSLLDSLHLEEVYNFGNHDKDIVVPTNGGRYDVDLTNRTRRAIYWEEQPTSVRRCSWFFRGEGEKRHVPYEEHFAVKLEEEFRIALTTNTWHRRLEFPGGETIIIHNPNVVVHFQSSSAPDEWGNDPHEGQLRPRIVKRGIEEFENIEDGEPIQIDHLVFVVHGIGGFCDLKFRTVIEVVDDFRSIANGLLNSHFKKHVDERRIGRVEFLPISWHSTLHGDATGIDTLMHPITLNSIPKLRYFANDTILDVLFYTSPVYCQTIVNQVSSEINRMYHQFLERNPSFKGNVSLIGHSLGSVILFDILLHQRRNFTGDGSEESEGEISPAPAFSPASSEDEKENESNEEKKIDVADLLKKLGLEEYYDKFENEKIDGDSLLLCSENDLKDLSIPLGPRKKLIEHLQNKREDIARKNVEKETRNEARLKKRFKKPVLLRRKSLSTVNYMVGCAGTGQPFVSYTRLDFQPSCFFALGSPIAMFLTVRGLHTIRRDFCLPTCSAYFNIFHPFDPVAYRMEPLVDPSFTLKPVLIPHHKGRKRMHLEIKESLARVGSDLKQLLVESLKSTWNSINEFARAHKSSPAEIEAEIEKLAREQEQQMEDNNEDDSEVTSSVSAADVPEEYASIGKLNGGRRFDYVLQEKPIESFNEYLFALQSHMCYWESEDTVLLVLKEAYATLGIQPSMVGSLANLSSREFQGKPELSSARDVEPELKHLQLDLALAKDKKELAQEELVSNPLSAQAENHHYSKERNPAVPQSDKTILGPPPLCGFVRQPLVKK